jgi:hypothetical protein
MLAPGMRAKVERSTKPVARRKYFPNLLIFDSPYYLFPAQTRVRVSGVREFALIPSCSVAIQNAQPASGDIGANSLEAQWSAYGLWLFLF